MQYSLYNSRISLAIYVPVTIGRSRTLVRTERDKNTSFLSFFFSSSLSSESSSALAAYFDLKRDVLKLTKKQERKVKVPARQCQL